MKDKSYVILSVIFSTLAMCIVDGIIQPTYFYKSLIKIVMFLLIPMIYFHVYKNNHLKELFIPKKKDLLLAIPLGAVVFISIITAYLLSNTFIDLSQIKESLMASMRVNADNFIYVAIYISFVNSLLEEFFFRGYAFLTLKKVGDTKLAYIFSSVMFAIYHVGMTSGWFNPLIYILALLGLFIGGCIFNFLNEKCDNIYPSWMVHMCANFAINTIGLIMFDMI